MRAVPLLITALVLASCDSMPVLWRTASPEEIEQVKARDQSDQTYARLRRADLHRRTREEEQRIESVVQAFSLRDVRNCTRLGLLYSEDLYDARRLALERGGDTILGQRNRYELHKGVFVEDYAVYRCNR